MNAIRHTISRAPQRYGNLLELCNFPYSSRYYLNKGLLNGAIISCAAEFFPVMLIAHWLACGGAEEKAEDIMRQVSL
jgi:hypothetical protein